MYEYNVVYIYDIYIYIYYLTYTIYFYLYENIYVDIYCIYIYIDLRLKSIEHFTISKTNEFPNQHFFGANENSGGGSGTDINDILFGRISFNVHLCFGGFFIFTPTWGNDPI